MKTSGESVCGRVCGFRTACAVVDRGCACCELHPESPQDTQPSGHSRPQHQHSKRLTRSPQSTQPSGQQTLAHCTQQAHSAQRTRSLRNTRSSQRTQPYPLHTHPTGPTAAFGLSRREAFTKAARCPGEAEKPPRRPSGAFHDE
jgi:hypothetical protein